MRVAMHDGASMTADWSICAYWHNNPVNRHICYAQACLCLQPCQKTYESSPCTCSTLRILTAHPPIITPADLVRPPADTTLGHPPQSLLFRMAMWCFTTQHRLNKHVVSCVQSKNYSWSQSCVRWPRCQTNRYVWQCKLKHPCWCCVKSACTFHHRLAAVYTCLATLACSRYNSREVQVLDIQNRTLQCHSGPY